MDIENVREYCLSKKNATEDFPFDETTLVFRVENKIFAMVDLENTEWFCLKCNPEYAIELRERYKAIKGAWHMNKKYWNQVDFMGLQDDFVFHLIDHSYKEVLLHLPKKIQESYGLQNE